MTTSLRSKVFAEAILLFHGYDFVIQKKWDKEEHLCLSIKKGGNLVQTPTKFKLDAFEKPITQAKIKGMFGQLLPLSPEELGTSFLTLLTDNWDKIQEVINAPVEIPEEEKSERVCFLWDDKVIIQQIYDPQKDHSCFAVWNGQSVTYQDTYTASDGTLYKPLNGDEIGKKYINLASKVGYNGTLEKLILDIIEFSKPYIDISDDFREFAAYYVVFSWVYDIGNTTPYLRFLGDTGCGKSRGLDVFGRLCYNSIFVSGAITTAPVYRLIAKWTGTLLFEESDLKGSDETNELIKIINCGIERGRPVTRCNPNDAEQIDFFDPFGPKVFVSRHNFDDPATEGRCLTTTMKETERRDIPPELPPEFYLKAQELRDRLLDFRLRNYTTLKPSTNNFLPEDLEPRLKQMSMPMLVLFNGKDDPAYKRFEVFLVGYQRKLREIRADSFAGSVFNTLVDLMDDRETNEEETPITCKEIAENLKTSASKVSKEIRAVGMTTEIRHAHAKDEDGNSKRKSYRAIVCSDDVWSVVCRRYIPNDVKPIKSALLEPIKTKQTLLTDGGGLQC